MLLKRKGSKTTFSNLYYLIILALLSIFFELSYATKGFKNCTKVTTSLVHEDCSFCICDCRVKPEPHFRYAYRRFQEVRSTFRYDPSKSECTWSLNRSTAKDEDKITVTLYEWSEETDKGIPLPECCGVPFKQKRCHAKINVGNQIWFSLNINGQRISPSLHIYQSRPVDRYRLYCEKGKLTLDFCLLVDIFDGKLKVLENSISATSAGSQTSMVQLMVCSTKIPQAIVSNYGNKTEDLRELLPTPLYVFNADLEDDNVVLVEQNMSFEVENCTFPFNVSSLHDAALENRNGLFCFFYRDKKMENTTLYCLGKNDTSNNNQHKDTLVATAVGGAVAVVILVAIVAVVICWRRKHEPKSKSKVVYQTWRKRDGDSARNTTKDESEKRVKEGTDQDERLLGQIPT